VILPNWCINGIFYLQVLEHFLHPFSVICHIEHSLAEHSPYHLEKLAVEVAVIVHASCWTTKACLASVAVNEVKLTPHYYSTAGLLALVNVEGTVIKRKVVIVLLEKPEKS